MICCCFGRGTIETSLDRTSSVLLVDDDIDMLQYLDQSLEDFYEVETAFSADEAMEKIKQKFFDVVVTDYRMPGDTGIGLAAKIGEYDESIPVVLMTGYGDKELAITALRSRLFDYIDKPFKKVELESILARALLEKKKSSALSLFAAEVAHEIRSPLMTIIGVLDLILAETKDSKNLDLLKRALGAANRIEQIAKMMTHETRRDKEHEHKYIDLKETLLDVLDLMQDRFDVKMIKTSLDMPDPPILLFGHEGDLYSILQNLIANAIDSFEKVKRKRKEVVIKMHTDKSFIVVSVEDNGSGIAKDGLKKIFDSYYTTKTVGRGTGIGLHLVKKLVEQHDGTIEVASEVGKGTTFTVTFPMVES